MPSYDEVTRLGDLSSIYTVDGKWTGKPAYPKELENIVIERYPHQNEQGIVLGYSYGCPELNLMGFIYKVDVMDEIDKLIETGKVWQILPCKTG